MKHDILTKEINGDAFVRLSDLVTALEIEEKKLINPGQKIIIKMLVAQLKQFK